MVTFGFIYVPPKPFGSALLHVSFHRNAFQFYRKNINKGIGNQQNCGKKATRMYRVAENKADPNYFAEIYPLEAKNSAIKTAPPAAP
ncbi:MAG: hypothetical protein ACI4RV_00420, partial [Eubacteriales bacterium]